MTKEEKPVGTLSRSVCGVVTDANAERTVRPGNTPQLESWGAQGVLTEKAQNDTGVQDQTIALTPIKFHNIAATSK